MRCHDSTVILCTFHLLDDRCWLLLTLCDKSKSTKSRIFNISVVNQNCTNTHPSRTAVCIQTTAVHRNSWTLLIESNWFFLFIHFIFVAFRNFALLMHRQCICVFICRLCLFWASSTTTSSNSLFFIWIYFFFFFICLRVSSWVSQHTRNVSHEIIFVVAVAFFV